MDHKEIENKLWLDFLNRIEIEKNARPEGIIRFVFDTGYFEGVNVEQFQRMALARLSDMKIVKEIWPFYNARSNRSALPMPVWRQDEVLQPLLKEEILPRPQPAGYDLEFYSHELFTSTIQFLRSSLKAGGINAVPIFQFKLVKRDIIICDFEKKEEWYIHKVNLGGTAHQLLEFMQNEGRYDVTREELANNKIFVKSLGDLVVEMKFVGDLKELFFDVGRDRLVLNEIITSADLSALGLTKAKIRAQLKAIGATR